MKSFCAGTVLLACCATVNGQPPPPDRTPRAVSTSASFVGRMMAFDANHDGRLTRDEITDARLLELFDRADANRDGFVTTEELTALYTAESASVARGPRNGGPGGPDRGRPDQRAQPGQILPAFMQRALALTPEQTASLEHLQHETDLKLNALLTPEQRTRLKEMEQRGPGGPGPGPGGEGGPRRPDQP